MFDVCFAMLIAATVFTATWSVSELIIVRKDYDARSAGEPRGRPVLSRPVVVSQ
jgi:hypothetical protein